MGPIFPSFCIQSMALIDFLLLRGVPLQRRRDRSTDAWCRLVGVVTRTFRPLANLRPRRCFPVSASPVWSSLDSFWRENPRRTTTYPPYASSNISDFRRRDSSLSLSLSLLVARSLFFHDKVIDIFQRNVSIGYTNVNTQRDSAIQRAYDDQRACFQTIQLFADFLLWSSCYLFSYFFLGSTFFRSHLRFCQSDWLLIIALVGLCSWKLGGGGGLPETRGGFLG